MDAGSGLRPSERLGLWRLLEKDLSDPRDPDLIICVFRGMGATDSGGSGPPVPIASNQSHCEMLPPPPPDMIGRRNEWSRLAEFATSGAHHPTLGIAWGRRRVGKSFLLQALTRTLGGFYFEATRGSQAEALRDLGASLGAFQGTAGPLALADWGAALETLLSLGKEQELPVVLDEFPYLLEHSPSLDFLLQRALGPGARHSSSGRERLIPCGSAMTVMRSVLGGTAPLRGRAGLDLRVSPFHFRIARELHGIEDFATAVRTFAVIGGVAAYAREMVDGDLPAGASDFHRWVCRRVLSPSAPLFHEVGLLLAEDPSTSKARKINLYHATLAGIATGHHAHAKLAGFEPVRKTHQSASRTGRGSVRLKRPKSLL